MQEATPACVLFKAVFLHLQMFQKETQNFQILLLQWQMEQFSPFEKAPLSFVIFFFDNVSFL